MNVWLPAVRAHSGADVFTIRLAHALATRGVRAEIAWLPLRAEYAPWSVRIPKVPAGTDLAHINSWLPARFIPKALPVVTTVHHVVHDPAMTPYKTRAQTLYHRAWIRRIETHAISCADAVTAVSHYTARQTTAAFGPRTLTVIPHWIDAERFSPAPQSAPHTPFRLLYVGNWSRRKGADLLAPIMRRLGPAFELRFTTGARPQSAPHDLPSNMIALGLLSGTDALVSAYRFADALLAPSRLEGFGLAALEAQACGLPVIAADASALPEVVAHGHTGFLCPPDDIDAFAGAARILAKDHALWRSMRDAARARVRQLFSDDVALPAYVEVYRRVLG
ncbi:MAG: glycosyltransferase family 4 protein [Gammaproteobacteria bacterium]